MSPHPHASALVLQVMGVAEKDADMPLRVLVNLHRTQLRAPLERFAAGVPKERGWFGTRIPRIGAMLDALDEDWVASDAAPEKIASARIRAANKQWPMLYNGNIFQRQAELEALNDRFDSFYDDVSDRDILALAGTPNPVVSELLIWAIDAWQLYEPLKCLHQLSWPGADLEYPLQMLEAELAVHTDVEDLIRTYSC